MDTVYRVVERRNGYKIRKIFADKNTFIWDLSEEVYSSPEEAEIAIQNIKDVHFTTND